MRTLALTLLLCTVCIADAQIFLKKKQVASAGVAAGGTVNTLTNNLFAYWTLDDTNNLVDSTGNGNTLTMNGLVHGLSGFISNAAGYTNNINNWLQAADANGLSALESSLTIAGWVYHDATNSAQTIFAKDGGSSPSREYELLWQPSQLIWEFKIYTNATSTGIVDIFAPAGAVTTGSWYFLVAAVDATNLVSKLRWGYTNGTPGLTGWTNSATFGGFGPGGKGTNTTRIFQIGMRASGSAMRGKIDEVGVWDRLLTDSEITNLFNSGTGKTWPLN